ncbi:hypothetical protein [Acidomonas methanolica]|uniref:hypothetical protein n=1 Tax=Acidomonas methanolica TaxID=437 RepID=UPI002119BEF3|nr:hypothetical protein [Acidomonas methanolica]
MTETTETDATPEREQPEKEWPETEWTVRIIDHSGASEEDDNVVETISGFLDLPHANAFARAYVRDSIERCREGGATGRAVLEAWYAFGEDATVADSGVEGWTSADELDHFSEEPATPMERDWRSLDPRRLVQDDEDDAPEE